MAAKKKTRHGATQPESERKNKQVLLRLPPDVEARLREAAGNQEMKLSAFVTRLLRVMTEHPEVPGGALLDDLRGPFG